MAIVMGVDQHRAQFTTEWIDTTTGEIGRAHGAGAPLESAPPLVRFLGAELEVAWEATMGGRFAAAGRASRRPGVAGSADASKTTVSRGLGAASGSHRICQSAFTILQPSGVRTR